MHNNRDIAIELKEFVLDFIQVQIAKCLRILEIGMGPDVGIIAVLVQQEIDAFIPLAYALEAHIEKQELSKDTLQPILNILKFYLEQEALRGKAALFISDNPVHREAKRRVSEQHRILESISDKLGIDYASLANDASLTTAQRQYRLTSARVAWVHLDIIFRRSTAGLNQVATDIIHTNLLPDGYYDQNMDDLKKFKIYCEDVIQGLENRGGMVEASERMTLELYHQCKKGWDEHLQRLQSLSLEI